MAASRNDDDGTQRQQAATRQQCRRCALCVCNIYVSSATERFCLYISNTRDACGLSLKLILNFVSSTFCFVSCFSLWFISVSATRYNTPRTNRPNGNRTPAFGHSYSSGSRHKQQPVSDHHVIQRGTTICYHMCIIASGLLGSLIKFVI